MATLHNFELSFALATKVRFPPCRSSLLARRWSNLGIQKDRFDCMHALLVKMIVDVSMNGSEFVNPAEVARRKRKASDYENLTPDYNLLITKA